MDAILVDAALQAPVDDAMVDNGGKPALYDRGSDFYLNRIDVSPEGYTDHQRHELQISPDRTTATTGALPAGVYRLEVRPTEMEPDDIWAFRGERANFITQRAYELIDAGTTPGVAQNIAESNSQGTDGHGHALAPDILAHRDALKAYDADKQTAEQAKGFTITTTAGPSSPKAAWIHEVGGVRDDSGKFIKAKVVVNLVKPAKAETTIAGTMEVNGETTSFTIKVAKGRLSGLATIQTNVPSSRGDDFRNFAARIKFEPLNATNVEMQSNYGWWQWVEEGGKARFSPDGHDKTGANFQYAPDQGQLLEGNRNLAAIEHSDLARP